MAENSQEGSENSQEGSLYLVDERLSTFSGSNWPFDSGPCTPLKMAEAGFYYCGTVTSPDWVRCVVCHKEMEGWEETDNPRDEHKRCQADCAFLKIKDPYEITFGDILELEKAALQNYTELELAKLSADLEETVETVRDKLLKTSEQEQS